MTNVCILNVFANVRTDGVQLITVFDLYVFRFTEEELLGGLPRVNNTQRHSQINKKKNV